MDDFDIGGIDEVIHGRLRLGIMAYLAGGGGGAADFTELKSRLQASDGNLSVHLRKLEEAGYVAIERVTGTLHGRHGSFVLQHSGSMSAGAQQLTIGVVPDSGTGELRGLQGTLVVTIADGKHSYAFTYTLPP